MACGCTQVRMYNILKACLLIYNFLFMLFGYGVVGLGIYSEVFRQELTEAHHVFFTPSIFLICFGGIASFFATVGFIGALRDNLFLLKFFVVSIVVCVLVELAAGVTALILKDPAKDFVNKYVLKAMVTYYDDHDLKDIIDYVQEEFQCCGGMLYKDWQVNPYHNCTAPGPSACGVPYSCCIQDPDDELIINSMCGYDTIELPILEVVDVIYLTGCIEAVLDFVWNHLDIFAGILLGIFLPQAVGIFLGSFYMEVLNKIIASLPPKDKERRLLGETLA